MIPKHRLHRIGQVIWEIPREHRQDMRVPARVYATEAMLDDITRDRALEQLVNVATLPGIVDHALAMPDVHEGYGFPVGGVAAFDARSGIVSPGGIGYDINCGVRLLRSHETLDRARGHLEKLATALYAEIPSGVGTGGRLKLADRDLDPVLARGAAAMIERGYGERSDLDATESSGTLTGADPDFVSAHAKDRGRDQLGTMGAGNHFVEVGVVERVFDAEQAAHLQLAKGQLTVLIHTGSRGLGHQVATDYIKIMMQTLPRHGITLADRELACAPFDSPEGQRYFAAMAAAANFAWANRQLTTWEVRKAWKDALGPSAGALEMLYDVAHNIAKIEEHAESHGSRRVIVHRKGATRAFPGQPVIIPGSMGTGSYVLVGEPGSMRQTFGSTCHGAGRRLSRTAARKQVEGEQLRRNLNAQGIVIRAGSTKGLAEEAPLAYKDVDQVVEAVDQAGIARRVVRLRPVAVIKG